MRRTVLILVIWATASTAAAQEISDLWRHFLAGAEPRGGIVRLDLDLTGDGVPEIFLSDSSLWEKSARTWMVYSPREDGFLVLGTLRFHEKLVRFDPSQGLVTAWEPRGTGRYQKIDYRVSTSGIETLRTQEIDEEAGGESVEEVYSVLNTIDEHRAELGFKVAAASLDEVQKGLSGSEVLWRDLRTGMAVKGLRRIVGERAEGFTKGTGAASTILEHFKACRVLGSRQQVYMLQFDATGDGVPEIFLNSTVWHPSLEWLIYSRQDDGYRHLGGLAFDHSRIRFDPETKTLRILRRSPKVIEGFRIGREGVQKQDVIDWSMNWSGVGAPELQKMKDWSQAVGLDVVAASLPELLSDPQAAEWRSLETEDTVTPAVDIAKKLVDSGS